MNEKKKNREIINDFYAVQSDKNNFFDSCARNEMKLKTPTPRYNYFILFF